jgi:transcriptional regulator with XRE-family HTH domain
MSKLCGPNADASGARDPAAIFWHGMPRSHILRSEEFRRLGDTHVLATLWGGSWKDRLSEEAKAAGTTRDTIYAGAVDHLLDAYEILRQCTEALTPARLLEHLHLRQPGAVFLDDDTEALTAGLRWLALKGFAIRQEGRAWTVSGLAKKRFLDVFIAGWPDQARKEWEHLRHPAPLGVTTDACTPERPHDMQRRLELILDANDVTIIEYRTGDNDAGHWDLRRHQPDGPFLDAALYDSGRRLGVEPVLLRVGANRVQLEAHLLHHIKDQTLDGRMTLGERLVLLRRLAGLSKGALAQAVGVTHETIGNLETGEVREFHNRHNWQRLADALGVDLFVLLSGITRADAVTATRTLEDRLRLFCQAEGLLVCDLQQELKGWPAQMSRARRAIAPVASFRQALLAKFVTTKPAEEELFGLDIERTADPHRATKLREHSGKFTPNTATLPEAILRTILKEPSVFGLAVQGRLTVKDYMDQCALHVDVSEGTIRRVFSKLVERGELLACRPPRLHGSIGYGLAPRHARAAEEGQPSKATTAPGDVTPTGL